MTHETSSSLLRASCVQNTISSKRILTQRLLQDISEELAAGRLLGEERIDILKQYALPHIELGWIQYINKNYLPAAFRGPRPLGKRSYTLKGSETNDDRLSDSPRPRPAVETPWKARFFCLEKSCSTLTCCILGSLPLQNTLDYRRATTQTSVISALHPRLAWEPCGHPYSIEL